MVMIMLLKVVMKVEIVVVVASSDGSDDSCTGLKELHVDLFVVYSDIYLLGSEYQAKFLKMYPLIFLFCFSLSSLY